MSLPLNQRPYINDMDDWELLRAYSDGGSEEAFATLTSRYVDLVYSAALRQCGDAEEARDVTQAVFLILARKGTGLRKGTILSGWLYRTARYVALEAMRSQTRRKRREDAVALMNNETEPTAEELWKEVAPRIDAAMERLNESDRAAVLLRFFHGRSLCELAKALGVTEDAAKKRVARALERLRQQLRREGLTSSSSLLAAALAAYAVQSAPATMGAVVSTAVAGSVASAEILSKGAIQMIALTKFKTTVACVAAMALAAGTATVTIQGNRVAEENARLQAQVNRARTDAAAVKGDSLAKLAEAEKENRELKQQAGQLYQLRNTVAQMQAAEKSRGEAVRNGALRLQAAPPQFCNMAETLRELQFEKFVAAGHKAMRLQPISDAQRAEYVREIDFFKNVGLALRIYASNHGDEFPDSLEKLYDTDLLTEPMKKQLQEGRYEYHVFQEAEKKPGLPAVWWRAADDKGIRLMVMNDGSSQMIREPADVEQPGYLAMGGAK
jgi:RNA polymerase sigma factor (sigma-70 family)